MKRGEVWWAVLPDPASSEPGYRRPVLILQSDIFNRSRIRTIIATAITSNTRLADAPGNVLLPAKVSGLSRTSVINVSQIVSVDKSFLQQRVRMLPATLLARVEDGIRMVLQL